MTHAEQIADDIVKQTDPRLSAAVNRYGCRAMCLLAIPQYVAGRALSAEQVADILARGRHVDNVIISDKVRTGAAEHWLINEAFRLLGVDRRGRQVGWTDAHVDSVAWQYMISHWATGGPDGHFTLMDRGQNELYDPHDPAQAGYEIDKRQIIRKLVYATWAT